MTQKNHRLTVFRLTLSLLVGSISLSTIGCTNAAVSNVPAAPSANTAAPIARTPAPEKSAPIVISDAPVVSSEPVTSPATRDAVPVKPEPEKVADSIASTQVTPDAGTARQATQPETIEYPEITEGMGYGTFRRAAADKGWQPNISPNCTANVDPGSALCEQLPELQSCDRDFCQMVFSRVRTGKLITLKVFGGNSDQNALGRDSKWRVISWSIAADNSQP